jgi:hypothetical protein
MDAATIMAQGGSGLDGNWTNANPGNAGLARIIVDGTRVHPYGACHPTACDWGWIAAQGFASKVENHDIFSLLASTDEGFAKVVMTISLDPDGRLRVQVYSHYTDHSGRSDASHVDYFTR